MRWSRRQRRPVADTSKKTRWQYCNVLEAGADHRQLWIFNSSRAGFTLSREQSIPPNDVLPPGLVAKDWKMLLQPRLNVALLPIEKVFLRVVPLPAGSFDETLSMVELQL